MIVEIRDELFELGTNDGLLREILRQSMRGRFRARVKPVYRRRGDRAVNAWIARQSPDVQEVARQGLDAGLLRPERAWPDGRREPTVVLEQREDASWPRSFDEDEACLPLGEDAERILLNRPLRLKIEDERSDWHFLRRVVPATWRKTWNRAVKRLWIEPEHGGGQGSMHKVIEDELPNDPVRRLRTWAMFDSDATAAGQPASSAQHTCEVCERVGVPYHMLERREIENYIPERAMRAWSDRICLEIRQQSKKRKELDAATRLSQGVERYWTSPADERHYIDLKKKVNKATKRGEVADIWCDDSDISERELDADGWHDERQAIFDSLFASF